MFELKVVTKRRPFVRSKAASSPSRHTDSEGERPGRPMLVESAMSSRTPASPRAFRRSMPVSRPSRGSGSILKSPECTSTPWGVCRTRAQASGMLWVTGIHSASISPSPTFTRP